MVEDVEDAHGVSAASSFRTDRLVRLAIMANRYSMIAFIPFAALLLTYGDALFGVWFTPQFVRSSAPLLSIFVIGGFADASQANSGSMLYGLAKHQVFTQLMLAESLLSLSAIAYFTSAGDL